MDYNRQAKVNFDSVMHNAAKADKLLREAYLALHSYKAGLDAMEEIPAYLHPLYDQLMTTLDGMKPAQDGAYQLSMMTSKVLRSMGR